MFSFKSSLRRVPALWTAPLWVGLTVTYCLAYNTGPLPSWYRWAPAVVASATFWPCALSYAAAFGLAIWAGGQVRRDCVWALAPTRSRLRIAAGALAVPIAVAWATLLAPVAIRLLSLRLAPTPVMAVAEPVVMMLGIGACWAISGFVIGQVAPRLVSAPIGVVATWYAVATSGSYEHPMWPRHMLGEIDAGLGFGERYRLVTVAVPLAFAAVIAAALTAVWLSSRIALRVGVIVVALVALVGCVHVAAPWPIASAPTTSASPPRRCHQGNPEVCIAATAGQVDNLAAIAHAVDGTLDTLRRAGVHTPTPSRIVDNLLVRGRGPLPDHVERIPHE